MNRITPEMVKEAYEKTGIIPITATWADWADWERNNKCGCALTACYYAKAENPMDFGDYVEFNGDYEAILSYALDLKKMYIEGFIRGFDNSLPYGRSCDIEIIGYADGQAARKAMFGEGWI